MIFGAKMANSGAGHREHEDGDQLRHARLQVAQEPLQGAGEVLCLLHRCAASAHGARRGAAARPEPGSPARGPSPPAPCVWCARRRSCKFLLGELRRDDLAVDLAACRISSRWVPMPTTRPSSRTMIRSASMTVVTRWATMITVASAVSFRSAARSCASVLKSRAEKRVVEDVDLGLPDERPGDGQALLLPAGQVRPALGDHRLEAVRHGQDELAAPARSPRRAPPPRRWPPRGRSGCCPAMVSLNSTAFCGTKPELGPQRLLRHLADVHAVHAGCCPRPRRRNGG